MSAARSKRADGVPALPAACMAAFNSSPTVWVVSEVFRLTEIGVTEKPGPESWKMAVALPAVPLAFTILATLVVEAAARFVPVALCVVS